jgi:putative intracellular protease/amidase
MNAKIVHLFVFETLADWEAAFAVAAINNLRLQSPPGCYRVVTAAATLAPVRTMGGVRIQPDVALDAVTAESSAMLILPGGHAWETGANEEALQLASRFITSGTPVVATCAATLALARAGLLDHLRLNGNSREYLISSGFRGAGFYCGVPARTDKSTIAATEIAPMDFAREIFRMLNVKSIASTEPWYGMFKYTDAVRYSSLATN